MLLQNFKLTVEMIDATFERSIDLRIICKSKKVYFSQNHSLYRYKVEVAIRTDGVSSSSSKYYPGSTSEINILYDRKEETKNRISKYEDNDEYVDKCEMYENCLGS